jgi:hypothetical protein
MTRHIELEVRLSRGLAVVAEADDLVENALGDFPFGGFGNFDNFVVADDGDFVAVGIEADAFAGNVVDDDGIEIL